MRSQVLRRVGVDHLLPLGCFLVISLAFFGRPVLAHPAGRYVGGGDPGLFIWSLAWWPHAVEHGLNPIWTHAIWAPWGVNLAWATAVPGAGLLLAPVTLAAGPVVAYNVAAVAAPALAAWTAYLLCRALPADRFASAAGGYAFGFSSYMLGQTLGHLHMTLVFVVPLIALVVLRAVRGELGARGLVLRLAPLLALQFLFSTEILFTSTLALLIALAVAALFVPATRAGLRALALPIVVAYAVCAVIVSPFLYYAIAGGFRSDALNFTDKFPGDLLNLVFPTVLTEFGGGHPPSIVYRFAGNYSEQGLYLGFPLLAVVAAYAIGNRRSGPARFLVAALAIAIVAALGRTLNVGGHTVVRMPWRAVADLPLFNNVLPVRLSLFTSLLAAVILALWASAPDRRLARRAVAVVAALALVPKLTLPYWHSSVNAPAFIADALYRHYLLPNETVFVLHRSGGPEAMLWQAKAGFYYRMADGYIQPSPPPAVQHYAAVKAYYLASEAPPARMDELLTYARDAGFTKVAIQKGVDRGWGPFMRRAGVPAPVDTGGMLLYTLPAR